MGWRKIQKEDIKRGTVIRMGNLMNDGSYCMATIVAVRENEPIWNYVKVARPYVYAHEHFDSNSGLIGSEVFDIGMDKLLNPSTDVEVFQGRDEVRSLVT